MSITDAIERPVLVTPTRPRRPLSTLQLFKTAQTNALSVWDEEVFDELFVERRFFWGRMFVVSDPEGIRRVLQDNHENYPHLASVRRMFRFGSGTSIFCTQGEMWRRHRRLMNPTLNPHAVLGDVPLLIEAAEHLAEYLASQPAGTVIELGQTFGHLVILSTRALFASDDRELEPMLDRMAHYPLEQSLFHLVRLPGWLPFAARYDGSRAEAEHFRPMLDRLIATRRDPAYAGRHDLIWRLVHAEHRGDPQFTDAELRDEIITLGATSYTVLRPLTWVWYLLALHPWAEARLHAELDAVLAGRSPNASDLPRLTYLRAVLDETMRLYPPLPVFIPRSAAEDDTLCGQRIPRGSIVVIAPWIVHRHRRLWMDPDRFDPDRFAPENSAGRSRYAYLPFAVGPHSCTGALLVTMQMLATVAVLARRLRFRLIPNQRIEPVAWINLRPSRGIRMTIEPRRDVD